MSDLRQAAQKVVDAWDTYENGTMDHPLSGVMEVLRAALEAPKPLTEDEIERLIQTYSGYCQDDFVSVARAIERAHGIGGSDA